MGSSAPFGMTVDARNGVVRLGLSGDLDISSAPVLSDQLSRTDGATEIMVDLRELSFIDSTGLHALISAWQRAGENGHRLLVVGCTTPARRLFELTGTEFLLDEREAVSTLDQFTRMTTLEVSPIIHLAGDPSG